MGCRFPLESANIVANLSMGRVLECYQAIHDNNQYYEDFVMFLEHLEKSIQSEDAEKYLYLVKRLKKAIRDGRYELMKMKEQDDTEYIHKPMLKEQDSIEYIHKPTLKALIELSVLLEKCKIKALLLPRINNHNNYSYDWFMKDEYMLSQHILDKLVGMNPGKKCLILQPEARPEDPVIFGAFPNFEVALQQADSWPAVLFWESPEKYAFVPVDCELDLIYCFRLVRDSSDPIEALNQFAHEKKKPSVNFFHLSDLHFGSEAADKSKSRLKSIIKEKLAKNADDVYFVVSGDMVDSPKKKFLREYKEFAEFLEEQSGKRPISVLGNHDITTKGLSFFNRRKYLTSIICDYPKVKVLDDQKVIMLLFNSNTRGPWAEGEIGEEQMGEMGNQLDRLSISKGELDDYTLVAVLHHHLFPIPRPAFFAPEWFEHFIPSSVVDRSLRLRDATVFTEWLKKRNVRLVLHGHKHVPFFAEIDGITVVGGGSSTGNIKHVDPYRTYLAFDWVRVCGNKITCTHFAEDILGEKPGVIHPELGEW